MVAAYPPHPPTERIKVAITFFTGAAEAWWEHLKPEKKQEYSVSWRVFEETLRARFRPIEAAEFARSRIRNLQQKGDLSQYVEDIPS